MIDNIFSQIPPRVRYADISDFAVRVYAEIYAYNYLGIYKITNGQISQSLKRTKVTVSRAIGELIAAGLIEQRGDRGDRTIETIQIADKVVYDTTKAREIIAEMGALCKR